MIRRVFLVAVFLACALYSFAVEPPPERSCAVCGNVIPPGVKAWVAPLEGDRLQEAFKAGKFASTSIFTNSDPKNPKGLKVGVYLRFCDHCYNIPDRCSLCGLPINDQAKAFRTSDGRWICVRDVSSVVLDEDAALELFESAREAAVDVIGDFFALKNPKVSVHVTDVFDRTVGADGLHTMAVSKTTDSGSELVHYVSVYTGRPKQEAFYSCVHEYTHLWINENIHEHDIENDTREGLCELVAYKVAEARKDVAEQKRILDNPYTHGRIKDLVQYADEEDMAAILSWVPNGTARELAAGLATTTALKAKPPEIPLDVQIAEAQLARSQPPSQKETLGLNGIIHTPKGMMILLNGGLILKKGESGVVKLNGQPSRVRCAEIGTDAAVVQLDNSTNMLRLTVGHK